MKYLDNTSIKTCQDDDLKIRILIGGNCSKAIEPIEVIPSQEGGPYTFRTILSWCIVGLLGEKMGQPSLHCNIVKCSSVSKNQMAKHFLAVELKLRILESKELHHKLYNEDFNEVQPEKEYGVFGGLEKLSAENKQFIMMMENGAEFVNGHYQLPLPLRNPVLIKGQKVKNYRENSKLLGKAIYGK